MRRNITILPLSLVLVLQRLASELWNHLFLTRWFLPLQCAPDTCVDDPNFVRAFTRR